MKLSKCRFIIRPQGELILPPYKGSTFRGGFGHVLKRAVCVDKEGECAKCVLRHECIYSYVFETSVSQEAGEGGRLKGDYVPHPFVIEPPLDERQRYGIDDKLDFHLILVGRAVDYIPYFIFVFEELGRVGIGKGKGKYSLEKVISLNKDGKTLIYDGDSHHRDNPRVIDSAELTREAAQSNYHQVTLRFLTPTRIKYAGKLTRDINFEILVRNLLRRLSWLAEVHCGEKWELDWEKLIKRAKENVKTVHSDLKWHDWERYSQRQETRMKMGGFIGEITFEGDLAEFVPYLILGEYLHVGKGTVYGLGKYELKGE
ncbi:MAG: CRISPR system precrRNA processing endoribonuclease RAMP protein Cas6 [Methanosarcinales archaeon]|uniref:CRISPR system precrRNA processing endoribonuclease RAMP protein Cas6 n=1 Tax=Candidatus Ethanoperedens thermophilum TaxID=2766897 RepID=A0A848D8Q9_9EURY|nr:CRISPR system precrRNA processing endoribonuclease RAMP protein Cas6 [Candidatus Ethanoperedens thermophilum]